MNFIYCLGFCFTIVSYIFVINFYLCTCIDFSFSFKACELHILFRLLFYYCFLHFCNQSVWLLCLYGVYLCRIFLNSLYVFKVSMVGETLLVGIIYHMRCFV
jgi:hypothetical protein